MAKERVSVKMLRNFGLLMGIVAAVIGLWPLLSTGAPMRKWILSLAGLLVLPAVIYPRVLLPFYQLWMALGHLLGWLNTRLILGAMYYLVITPVGLARRFIGGDPLRREFEPERDSYRVLRAARPGVHMRRQF